MTATRLRNSSLLLRKYKKKRWNLKINKKERYSRVNILDYNKEI